MFSLPTTSPLPLPPAYDEEQERCAKIESVADASLTYCKQQLGAFCTVPNQIAVLTRMTEKLGAENPGTQLQLQRNTTDGAVVKATVNQDAGVQEINISDKRYLTVKKEIHPRHKARFDKNKKAIETKMISDAKLFHTISEAGGKIPPMGYANEVTNRLERILSRYWQFELKDKASQELLELFTRNDAALCGLLVFLEAKGIIPSPDF